MDAQKQQKQKRENQNQDDKYSNFSVNSDARSVASEKTQSNSLGYLQRSWRN